MALEEKNTRRMGSSDRSLASCLAYVKAMELEVVKASLLHMHCEAADRLRGISSVWSRPMCYDLVIETQAMRGHMLIGRG